MNKYQAKCFDYFVESGMPLNNLQINKMIILFLYFSYISFFTCSVNRSSEEKLHDNVQDNSIRKRN